MPLALEQAAAYIGVGTRIDDYLKSFRRRRIEVLRQGRPRDYPESVATTWALNFDRVAASSEASADILRCCAFLSPDSIPLEILSEGSSELGPHLSEALKSAGEDPVVLDDLLEPLIRFSLIERDPTERTLSVHRLVQEVVKDVLDENAERLWAERCARALSRVFPYVEFKSWAQCERLVSHARALLREVEAHDLHFEEAGRLFNQAGRYSYQRGRYREALPLFERSLRIREKALGPKHPDVAESLNNLAGLHDAQGQYAEALPLYERSLRIWEKALGPEHPDVAMSLNNLAGLHHAQGQYAEALPLYERSLRILEKSLGAEHPSVATSLNNLAGLHDAQGQYAEALPLFERSLRIREKVLGPEHPDVAQSLNNLAALHNAQGQHAEALPLYERSLRIFEKALGPEHPDVATSLENYAVLLRAMDPEGRKVEIEEMETRAKAIRALPR